MNRRSGERTQRIAANGPHTHGAIGRAAHELARAIHLRAQRVNDEGTAMTRQGRI